MDSNWIAYYKNYFSHHRIASIIGQYDNIYWWRVVCNTNTSSLWFVFPAITNYILTSPFINSQKLQHLQYISFFYPNKANKLALKKDCQKRRVPSYVTLSRVISTHRLPVLKLITYQFMSPHELPSYSTFTEQWKAAHLPYKDK